MARGENLGGGGGIGLFGLRVGDELEGGHGADDADITDRRHLGRKTAEAGLEDLTDLPCPAHKAAGLDL